MTFSGHSTIFFPRILYVEIHINPFSPKIHLTPLKISENHKGTLTMNGLIASNQNCRRVKRFLMVYF